MRAFIFLGIAICLTSCAPEGTMSDPLVCMATPVFEAPPLNTCEGTKRVRLTLVGDVLLHKSLQQFGYAHGFPALWAQASPFLQAADIAVANLEGPVAPGITRAGRQVPDPGPVFDNRVYTGYPMFNYHPTILQALQGLGVDLVSTANNHALDRGAVGIDLTLAGLEAVEIGAVGTRPSTGDGTFVLHQRSQLGDIAFIACSFATNGIRDPNHQVLRCYKDQETLLALVKQEATNPDIQAVIVLPHWGEEYVSQPNSRQQALTLALANAGATAVIGTHPHAVQPFTQLPAQGGQIVPVAYSTGNFVAGQRRMPAKVGAMVILDLCASEGKLVADRFGWIAMQMEFTPEAFWLNIAPRSEDGRLALAYRHLTNVAPGYSAQPQSCPAPEGP